MTGFGTLFFEVDAAGKRIVGNFNAGIPHGLCSFYAGAGANLTRVTGNWNQGTIEEIISKN